MDANIIPSAFKCPRLHFQILTLPIIISIKKEKKYSYIMLADITKQLLYDLNFSIKIIITIQTDVIFFL